MVYGPEFETSDVESLHYFKQAPLLTSICVHRPLTNAFKDLMLQRVEQHNLNDICGL